MNNEPRCIVIDRAHLAEVLAEPKLRPVTLELNSFADSEAQFLLLIVQPGERGVRHVICPTFDHLSATTLKALREILPGGRPIGWTLFLDSPSAEALRSLLDTTGTRVPTANPGVFN